MKERFTEEKKTNKKYENYLTRKKHPKIWMTHITSKGLVKKGGILHPDRIPYPGEYKDAQ